MSITAYTAGTTPPSNPTAAADVSSGSPNCTGLADGSRTCAIPLSLPAGTYDFLVELYDTPPAGGAVAGHLLGTGTLFNQTILQTQGNVVGVTIDGVVASLQLQPQLFTSISDGANHRFQLGLNIRDAAGYAIVGPNPLANPVAISTAGDTNSTLSFSTTTISTPLDPVIRVSYNGGIVGTAVIKASTTDGIAANSIFQPMFFSPRALTITAATPVTITVSDSGYNGTFQAQSSDSKCATVTATVTPPRVGAPAAFLVVPVANGSCIITIAGRSSVTVPVTVSLGETIPGATNWIIVPRSETLTVHEPGFTGSFTASSSGSACSVTPKSVPANGGAATFTVTALSEGTCTVTATGAKAHVYPFAILLDDWTSYAHDSTLSGFQPRPTGVSKSSVYGLSLRWTFATRSNIVSSPIVAGGLVYVETTSGDVFALDAKTGTEVWDAKPFGLAEIRSTPVVDNGLLFVGRHFPTGPSPLVALNAQTGAVAWTTTLAHEVRSSPLAVNGTLYIGTTGGDPPECAQSGLDAIDEATGKIKWTWIVNKTPNDGGSVWSAIAFDGTKLVVGTGNTCTQSVSTSNAVVAISPSGSVVWADTTSTSQLDNDVGGGSLIAGGRVYVTAKNGNFYVINDATGAPLYSFAMGAPSGYGSIGTPTTDGTTIVSSGGYRFDPDVPPYSESTAGGLLYGLDVTGKQKWHLGIASYPVNSYAALVNGVAFVGLDNVLTGLDIASGNSLWTYRSTPGDYFYGGPAVVESGVYAASNDGYVYAFGIGNTVTLQASHREAKSPNQYRPPNRTWHHSFGLPGDGD